MTIRTLTTCRAPFPLGVRSVAIAALVLASGSWPPIAVRGQMPDEATLAVPAVGLTFSSTVLAEDLGLWTKEGLHVRTVITPGVGSSNAVLAGSADFGIGSAASLMRANARGQRLVAIVQLMDRLTGEIVLRKDLADRAGITSAMPIEQRAQALRGRRVAVDGINAMPHLMLKHVASKGGLDPERDLTVTPMQPPSMIAALKSGAIDGFSSGMPWTVTAVRDGTAAMLVSAPRGDLADLYPFSFLVVVTRQGFCEEKPIACRKMAGGYKRAFAMIQDQPAAALAALRNRFNAVDRAVVADSFEQIRAATSRTGVIQEAGLRRGLAFQVEMGVMRADEKVPPLSELYTNRYVQ